MIKIPIVSRRLVPPSLSGRKEGRVTERGARRPARRADRRATEVSGESRVALIVGSLAASVPGAAPVPKDESGRIRRVYDTNKGAEFRNAADVRVRPYSRRA